MGHRIMMLTVLMLPLTLRAELWKCTDVDGKVEFTNNSEYLDSGVYKCVKGELPEIKRFNADEWKKQGRFVRPKGKVRRQSSRLTPRVQGVRFERAESADVVLEDSPKCRISGEVRSSIPMQVRLSFFRAKAGVDFLEVAVDDYTAQGCCSKHWSTVVEGVCSNPTVTAERIR